tara:strand:+ start:3496 stop:3645 length:150 start_codon:yes stop_codon:yes gene_type:complete
MDNKESEMNRFLRIAMAILRNKIKFKPQRKALAAKMWRKYNDKNERSSQ